MQWNVTAWLPHRTDTQGSPLYPAASQLNTLHISSFSGTQANVGIFIRFLPGISPRREHGTRLTFFVGNAQFLSWHTRTERAHQFVFK